MQPTLLHPPRGQMWLLFASLKTVQTMVVVFTEEETEAQGG